MKDKECRFGHVCNSGCQKDFDCPCLEEHCCVMSEDVCDRTCDDCYFKILDEQFDNPIQKIDALILEAKRLADNRN